MQACDAYGAAIFVAVLNMSSIYYLGYELGNSHLGQPHYGVVLVAGFVKIESSGRISIRK